MDEPNEADVCPHDVGYDVDCERCKSESEDAHLGMSGLSFDDVREDYDAVRPWIAAGHSAQAILAMLEHRLAIRQRASVAKPLSAPRMSDGDQSARSSQDSAESGVSPVDKTSSNEDTTSAIPPRALPQDQDAAVGELREEVGIAHVHNCDCHIRPGQSDPQCVDYRAVMLAALARLAPPQRAPAEPKGNDDAAEV